MLYILILQGRRYVNICVFMLVAILNPRVEDMLYIFAWEFSGYFADEVGYALFSLHTPLHIMHEWGPILGSVKLRNRGVV